MKETTLPVTIYLNIRLFPLAQPISAASVFETYKDFEEIMTDEEF